MAACLKKHRPACPCVACMTGVGNRLLSVVGMPDTKNALAHQLAAKRFCIYVHGEHEMTQSSAADVQALLPELAELVVSAVNLEMAPASIDPDAPLYRDGLSLDSIDILEIALVVARKYGTQIKAGDADNAKVFGSLRALAQYIVANRQSA